MKNIFQFLLFFSLLISCEQNKEIKPLNNKTGIEAVSSFRTALINIETVDTLSVFIKDKEVFKVTNVMPRFEEHFIYVNGSTFDLNNFHQSSLSVHQNKVTLFKIFLNK